MSITGSNTEATEDSIIEQFLDVFEGLGCLAGKCSIEIDATIRQVQQPPRRVPVPLKERLKAKSEELESMGVIARVEEPTEWISNLVIINKPDKLRICLDPVDLNRAIQRPRYQMPTLDDLLPELANAKVFTVLDALNGFWQIKLEERSSRLTTFWTPFGRYRWLRMPFGLCNASDEYLQRQYRTLEGLKGVASIADDTLMFGSEETVDEAIKQHDQNLQALLERARQSASNLTSRS